MFIPPTLSHKYFSFFQKLVLVSEMYSYLLPFYIFHFTNINFNVTFVILVKHKIAHKLEETFILFYFFKNLKVFAFVCILLVNTHQ